MDVFSFLLVDWPESRPPRRTIFNDWTLKGGRFSEVGRFNAIWVSGRTFPRVGDIARVQGEVEGGHHFVFYGFFSDYTVYRKKHFLLIVERMFRFFISSKILKTCYF